MILEQGVASTTVVIPTRCCNFPVHRLGTSHQGWNTTCKPTRNCRTHVSYTQYSGLFVHVRDGHRILHIGPLKKSLCYMVGLMSFGVARKMHAFVAFPGRHRQEFLELVKETCDDYAEISERALLRVMDLGRAPHPLQ